MALTNIFNEPRREIIETMVGVVLVGAAIGIVGYLALWLNNFQIDRTLPSAVFIVLVMIIVLIAVIVAIHSVGEWFCNWLEDRYNINLRPRERF